MDNVTIGDLFLLLGIVAIAGVTAVVVTILNGTSYKPTRRIPPYKRK